MLILIKQLEFTHGELLNKYQLFIDKAHFLLQHPTLIEMIRKLNYVDFITAIQRKLKKMFQ